MISISGDSASIFLIFYMKIHCVKRVRIWTYCGPYFPAFGPNNSEYGHFLRTDIYQRKVAREINTAQTCLDFPGVSLGSLGGIPRENIVQNERSVNF